MDETQASATEETQAGEPQAETPKAPAVKLQAIIGKVAGGIDVEGGEPADQHYTLAEADPANPELVNWLKADAGLGRTNGDNLNEILAHLIPAKLLENLSYCTLKVRIMDGDGRV